MPDSQTGLTTMERALCEAIIADPDRNVTRASKGIYRGGPGAVWKALKRPRVKAYLAKLENAARELAEQKTGEVIASRAEVLARLTRQSRLRLEDYFERT